MNDNSSTTNIVANYVSATAIQDLNPAALAYYGSIQQIFTVAPSVARAIVHELQAQRENLKLIASENFSSLATQLAQGNLFTDKYAEGYPGHRFYAGCENVDAIEGEAAALACKLFGAEHAYVQPHSGADANMLAFASILSAKIEQPIFEKLGISDPSLVDNINWEQLREAVTHQRLLAMETFSGGHLTHGYRRNFSSRLFETHLYTVNRETKLIDLDELRRQLREVKPFILLAGYSSYSRKINFAKLREMADEVGAVLMVDMAHFSGLVAGKVFNGEYDPVPYAHVVTSTTHKTLRGPRGGLILCKKEFSEWVDKGCPLFLGGPLPHAIAAKAVAFREAGTDAFRTYAGRIVENAQTLAEACMEESMEILTGGTDNHMVLLDVDRTFGLSGRQAETALRDCQLTLNRNILPFDQRGAWFTSGLRVGTPAVTTLGMGTSEMREVARIMKLVLSNTRPETITKGPKQGEISQVKYSTPSEVVEQARQRVRDILSHYPVYPELDIDLLLAAVSGD
jgi:glycine hydroxymethyltransferase